MTLKKQKVMLITPPCIKLYTGLRDAAPIYPPLGIAYIAAVLEKEGFDGSILDSYALGLSWKQIENAIIKRKPTVVGVACTTTTFSEALQIIKIVKKNNPKILTIIGGPHVTAVPKETLKRHKEIDVVVIGEGEYTFLDVVKRLEKGQRDFKNVLGIAYREKGKIVINKLRKPIENIDSFPFPVRHLLPVDRYKPPAKFPIKKPFMTVMSSRGCPNLCTFCSSKIIFGVTIRQRSAENVLQEIKEIVKKYGIKEITFVDDTFTINRKRLIAICKGMKELGVMWTCSARVNTVDEEVLKIMKNSGCKLIEYGVESGSQRILKNIKKGITVEQAIKAVKWTKNAKIMVCTAFMIGNPGENKKTIRKTIKLAKKLDPDMMQLSILTPYPGTEVYDIVKKKGELLKDFEEYESPKYFAPVIKLGDLSPQDLSKIWKRSMLEFYLRPKVMFRILKHAFSSKEELNKIVKGIIAFLYSMKGMTKR